MAGMYRSRIPAAKDAGPSVDDLVLQRAYQNLTQDMQRGQGRSSGGGTINSSSATPGCSQESLLASLMQKVMALETENAALKQQLAAASSAAGPQQDTPSVSGTAAAASEAEADRASAAEAAGTAAGTAVEAAASTAAAQPDCQQCKQAWQQVAEMKAFLADYGLTWVGDAGAPAQPSSSSAVSTTPAAPAPSASSPTQGNTPCTTSSSSSRGLPFELQDLQACIQDLNELVHAGEASIAPVSGPASSPAWRQLQVQEPVPLLVFRDGLQLGSSPMRSYEDATPTAILCDLFEGYFPGVLKKQYPEGVPLLLVDCSQMTMREAAAKGAAAASGGRKLTSFSELGLAVPVTHLQQGDLLARLPAHVIQDGRVVPVRGAVADYIGGSRPAAAAAAAGGGQVQGITRRSSGMQYTVLSRRSSADDSDEMTSSSMDAPGPYRQEQQQPVEAEQVGGSAAAAGGAEGTEGTDGQVATLQVRSEDGKQAFILKMKYADTIGRVKKCIDKHRAAQLQQPPTVGSYELRSAFPARVHTDDSMTLQEAQLVPNATLYMRAA